MAISHNCTHLALLAKDTGAGDFEEMSLMDGSHMTPEMLKVNPWHQIPNMSDGESPGLIALQVGFELPEKIQAYVADFMATCPSKAFLEAHDGFMASKLA